MVMARKQVLVQLNDELLATLDRAMASSGQSRSQLVRAAIADYLERFLEDDVDRQYREAYARIPDKPDPWADQLAEEAMQHLNEMDGGW